MISPVRTASTPRSAINARAATSSRALVRSRRRLLRLSVLTATVGTLSTKMSYSSKLRSSSFIGTVTEERRRWFPESVIWACACPISMPRSDSRASPRPRRDRASRRVTYMTCNSRHHELLLIEDREQRGYDHIGLEVPDAAALEAAGPESRRRAVLLGASSTASPGSIAGPGPRAGRPRLQALLRNGDVAAPAPGDRPIKFEHVSSRAWGPKPVERLLQRRIRFRFWTGWVRRKLVALRCRPSRPGARARAEAGALALRVVGADLNRWAGSGPSQQGRDQKLIWGHSSPWPRQQPLHLFPRPRRRDDRALRRPGEDASRRRLPGPTMARRARRDQSMIKHCAKSVDVRCAGDARVVSTACSGAM